MPTVYPPLSIGAPARLAMFRREASDPKRHFVRPMTWRDVRFADLRSPAGLGGGSGDGAPIWHTQDGAPVWRERFADDVGARIGIDHQGWYADADASETVRGLVVALPHGRFLAGYLQSMNDERVYLSRLFTDATDAAEFADSEARILAESESEYSRRWQEARRIEDAIESDLRRVRELFALRHSFDYARDELAEVAESIRSARAQLADEFADVDG